jgi:Cellulase (glycosyl hydrolase family 5)
MLDSPRGAIAAEISPGSRIATFVRRARPTLVGYTALVIATVATACSGGDDSQGAGSQPGTGGSATSSGGAGASAGKGGSSAVGGTGNSGSAGKTSSSGGTGNAPGAGTGGGGGAAGGNPNGGTGGNPSGATGGISGASTTGGASVGGAASGGSPNGGMPNVGGAGSGGTAGHGAAGTSSGAGAGGSAGTGGGTAICDFASGLNVAWVNFASDVPNPDLNTFKTIFKNTHDAGGRVVRWWFHTNGTTTPGYDSSGLANKLPQADIDGVKAILGAAHDAGVVIDISLWSFDMLQSNAGNAHTNNQALLENDVNRQAYIDNYLTPLVNAIKGTPGLYDWEIFNEPEGMGPSGWATYRTTEAAIQKTVNWFSSAIHTADPSALVTNGSQTFDYCSGVSGKNNYYSDSALIAAGGKQNGILDFYEVHYYTSNGSSNSSFTHPASYWNLDKKLVMGEFAAQATDGVAQNDLYTNLYTNGYDGAWAWSYDADYPWPAMQAPMQALFTAHADVGNCP